ncbi:unnamed protein product, partial [Candidula unifasciata]
MTFGTDYSFLHTIISTLVSFCIITAVTAAQARYYYSLSQSSPVFSEALYRQLAWNHPSL